MSKKGLGRGLQALISEGLSDEQNIKEIPVSDIEGNPDQPRKDFDEESLNELTDSLRTHGLLQPILVRPSGEKYYIIAGERRFRAAKLAGFSKISCIVQNCSEQEMAERAIIENIQRDNLNPIEEGFAYAKLIQDYGLTQEDVAKRVGKSRPTITNLLRVTQLPDPVLLLIRNDKISLGHAKVLASINDTSLQVLIAQKIAKEQLSVRETEEIIKNISETNTSKAKKRSTASINSMRDVEDKLHIAFQTKVKLKGQRDKGKIEIEYFSEDELNRLLDLWQIVIE